MTKNIPVDIEFLRHIGNYKIICNNGAVAHKVTGFPGNESMWVYVPAGKGNDAEGEGFLMNQPIMSDIKYGDPVTYHGGTERTKPSFLKRGHKVDEG